MKDETVNTQQDELEKLNTMIQKAKDAAFSLGPFWHMKLTVTKELFDKLISSNILTCDNNFYPDEYMGIPLDIGDKTEVRLDRDLGVR